MLPRMLLFILKVLKQLKPTRYDLKYATPSLSGTPFCAYFYEWLAYHRTYNTNGLRLLVRSFLERQMGRKRDLTLDSKRFLIATIYLRVSHCDHVVSMFNHTEACLGRGFTVYILWFMNIISGTIADCSLLNDVVLFCIPTLVLCSQTKGNSYQI